MLYFLYTYHNHKLKNKDCLILIRNVRLNKVQNLQI